MLFGVEKRRIGSCGTSGASWLAGMGDRMDVLALDVMVETEVVVEWRGRLKEAVESGRDGGVQLMCSSFPAVGSSRTETTVLWRLSFGGGD